MVLRGKYLAIQEYLEKQEKSQINLTLQLKELEKEKEMNTKVIRRKEIINIRVEINEIETKKTITKINETKRWFSEKINKIDKPLVKVTKGKKEKGPINKIRNERGEIKMDTTETHRIIREYHEQLYANKLDDLEEMDKFLESYNLLRLNHEVTENLTRLITNTENETVIKKLPKNKSPGLDGFTGKLYQTFKKDLIPILLILFQKTEEKGMLSNSFYEANITLIPKPNKKNTQKKYRPISLMNIDAKILNIIRDRNDKPIANIILNGEKLKAISLISGTRQGCSFTSHLSNIVLEVLAGAIEQEKEIKGIQIEKEEVKLSLFTDDMILYIENTKDSTKNY